MSDNTVLTIGELIENGIKNGEIKGIITGEKKYLMISRDDRFYGMQALDMVLFYFDKYNKEHPEYKLNEQYRKVLMDLLNGNDARNIYYASKCALLNIEFEKNPLFSLKLEDKDEVLRAAKAGLARMQVELKEYFAQLINPGKADIMFDIINSDVDRNISTMQM